VQRKNRVAVFPTKCNTILNNGCISANLLQHHKDIFATKILRCDIAVQTQPSLVWWLQQLSIAMQEMLMQHNNGVALFPTKFNGNPKNGCISINLLQHKK
jgi:hypothetical protein